MEALSLIDVSAEDDFLLDITSPPPHPDPTRAAGSSSVVGAGASDLVPAGGSPAVTAGRVLDPSGASDQAPERTESPKKTKSKSGSNLRKSLAWNSAFFTSEGVLDTDELGIVNSTFRKVQGSRLLPGIAEEMRRSGESTTSTLESGSFMLESLETELFDNVRASIQRTLGKPDKAPGMNAASSKTPRATAKAPPVAARKGVDRIPQSKISPLVSTSNCGVGSKQRLQVTSKAPTAAGVAQRAAEAKPSSKPPRAVLRVATMRAPMNTAATSGILDKRNSTGGIVNRQAVCKSANTSTNMHSRPGSIVNRQAVGKSANTSTNMHSRPGGVTKSCSTSKSGALSSAATSSLNNTLMGSMPSAKTKSPTLINKNRTAQRVNIRSSSRSDISKENPARASRNKIPTKSHGERASPIISPSSSLDSMSSVVSGTSTASAVGKISHTSESFSTRSSPLSPSLRKSNDQLPTTKPRPPTEGQSSGTPSVDNLKASEDTTTTHGKGVRPSGLRRPTPKIGYFDQQEPKLMAAAPHEESSPPRTKAPSLLLRVAQIETEPFKVTEHEASMRKTSTVVDTDVAKEIIPDLHQNIQANSDVCPLTAGLLSPKMLSASSTFGQQESEPMSPPSVSFGVVQMEVESSTVTEHEASMRKTSTVVDTDAAKEIIPDLYQNIQANGDVCPLTAGLLSPKMFSASSTFGQQESEPMAPLPLPLGVVQMEVGPSKVTEHEASIPKTSTVVVTDVAKEIIPDLHQNIQANGDVCPLTAGLLSPKMFSASSSTFGQQESEPMAPPSLPLGVVQMEVGPSKVTEHEASIPKTSTVVVTDVAKEIIPDLHQNIQANGDVSPLTAELLRPKMFSASSSTFGQQESEPMAPPSLPLGVVQMEVEPSKVTEHDASVYQPGTVTSTAMDNAKENILVSCHQNIQPVGDVSPLKENNLASHQNIQGVADASPLALLTKKLSSISIADASPMTQLSQKLSSISLGETTDQAS